jgi:hypothetical protein
MCKESEAANHQVKADSFRGKRPALSICSTKRWIGRRMIVSHRFVFGRQLGRRLACRTLQGDIPLQSRETWSTINSFVSKAQAIFTSKSVCVKFFVIQQARKFRSFLNVWETLCQMSEWVACNSIKEYAALSVNGCFFICGATAPGGPRPPPFGGF